MKPLFSGERDANGYLILGNPHQGCIWCGAAPVVTRSRPGCGKVAWHHPPTNCCPQRRHAQIMAERAAAPDYRRNEAEEYA